MNIAPHILGNGQMISLSVFCCSPAFFSPGKCGCLKLFSRPQISATFARCREWIAVHDVS